jgi:hypothetical protein
MLVSKELKSCEVFGRICRLTKVFAGKDRCERLRRGVVDRFVECSWSIKAFAECASRETTFEQLIQSALASEGGMPLIRSLREAVAHGYIEMSAERLQFLIWALN